MASRFFTLILLLSTLFVVGGCDSIGYYSQALTGQLGLMRRGESLAAVIENPQSSVVLKEQLALVQRLRVFAGQQLGLPVDGQYAHYIDLQRNFVVWNVFAAPELSLEAVSWCHPLVGCAEYRGYFSQEGAEGYARGLQMDGLDTYVGGVAAYSTLGWLNDPVLNTFVFRREPRLADLIFHELAHQVLYIPGDTVFNESFATAVAREGVRRWMLQSGQETDYIDYQRKAAQQESFVALITGLRDKLNELYTGEFGEAEKRAGKASSIAQMRADYETLKHRELALFKQTLPYDDWIYSSMNNAKINSVSAYFQLVPALEQLLNESGDLRLFYARCRELAELEKDERLEILRGGV